MKQGKTHIGVLLDRSGSMISIRDDMIGGFNSFLEEQKSIPGEATISLSRFDDKYEVVYSAINLSDAPGLNHENFVPRGSTAMRDALGRFIVETGEHLAKMAEDERPSLVVIYIITDGMENASREYSATRLKEMVQHQEEAYKWQFQYLGANQDAVLAGGEVGIAAAASVNYVATPKGVADLYKVSGEALRSARIGSRSSVNLTDEKRRRLMKSA